MIRTAPSICQSMGRLTILSCHPFPYAHPHLIGVLPTVMRQGINQAVNFTAYQYIKTQWLERTGKERPMT